MVKVSRWGITVLGVGVILALVGCVPAGSSKDSTTDTKAPIRIGLLAQMTGNSAADGKLMQEGAQLAIDELNESGGILGRKVELVTKDVADQVPDRVSTAVTELVSDPDVHLVVGGYPSSTNFEIDLLAEAEMPYLIGGNADQTADLISKAPDKYPTIWSFSPSFEGYSTELPRAIQGWIDEGSLSARDKSTYIVSNDSPYSNGIATGLSDNFRKLGWSVNGPEVIPTGQVNDWTSQLQRVRDLNPDVVIDTDYQVSNGATFLSQFRQQPSKSLLFIQYAPSVPEFLELAGDKANGLLYNLIGGPILSEKSPQSVALRKKFDTKYGTDPGVYGASIYEMVTSYGKIAESVGSVEDHLAIGAAYKDASFETALGKMQFDPKTHLAVAGDDAIPVQLFQIQAGKRVLIAPEIYANGSFELPDWMK